MKEEEEEKERERASYNDNFKWSVKFIDINLNTIFTRDIDYYYYFRKRFIFFFVIFNILNKHLIFQA